MTGQSTFLPVSKKIEALAQGYAKEIISKQGQLIEHSEESAVETDYQTVDVNSVDSEHIRSVGGESVVLDSIRHLELDRKLEELGLRRVNMNAAIGVRCDGRLFITVLAYHVIQAIRVRLSENGITNRWWTIRLHAVYPPPSDDVYEA